MSFRQAKRVRNLNATILWCRLSAVDTFIRCRSVPPVLSAPGSEQSIPVGRNHLPSSPPDEGRTDIPVCHPVKRHSFWQDTFSTCPQPPRQGCHSPKKLLSGIQRLCFSFAFPYANRPAVVIGLWCQVSSPDQLPRPALPRGNAEYVSLRVRHRRTKQSRPYQDGITSRHLPRTRVGQTFLSVIPSNDTRFGRIRFQRVPNHPARAVILPKSFYRESSVFASALLFCGVDSPQSTPLYAAGPCLRCSLHPAVNNPSL